MFRFRFLAVSLLLQAPIVNAQNTTCPYICENVNDGVCGIMEKTTKICTDEILLKAPAISNNQTARNALPATCGQLVFQLGGEVFQHQVAAGCLVPPSLKDCQRTKVTIEHFAEDGCGPMCGQLLNSCVLREKLRQACVAQFPVQDLDLEDQKTVCKNLAYRGLDEAVLPNYITAGCPGPLPSCETSGASAIRQQLLLGWIIIASSLPLMIL